MINHQNHAHTQSRSLNRPITLARMPVIGRPTPAYIQRQQSKYLARRNNNVAFWLVGIVFVVLAGVGTAGVFLMAFLALIF